jgi:anti-sigma regulatory factor (Ser/Thr protein kinase)/predicted N-acetyltransferase YhbS
MAKDTSVLTIPNDPSFLSLVRAYAMGAAAQVGFDDADSRAIRRAVDEACTHIIQTAFEPGEEQELSISCQRFPGGLKVAIADKGLPFDPASIRSYDASGGLDRDLSGLPFYLMQQAVDEVRFVNKGWEGKELQLTKYLKVPHVETYFTEEELRPYDEQVEPAPPMEYICRLLEPGDAVEVARCIYKTYGYTYPGEHLYYPERVVAMNRSGNLVSVVAVTEAGEVIGHCALSGHAGDPVMELAQAVVKPAHRGRGILKELSNLLAREAQQRDLAGLYVVAVTIHPYSQRVALKHGMHESAILLAYAPQHAKMKGFADEHLPQRESVVYAYMSLRREPAHLVFAPDHHRSIIERIYHNLGLEREFAPAEGSALHTDASQMLPAIPRFDLSTKVVSALGYAVIEVTRCGPGIEQEVKNRLRDLCQEGAAVVYLHLPLGDAHTPVLCQRLEQAGFFFSGVQPRPAQPAGAQGARCGDVLCLQYLNGPLIDYDRLQLYSDFGKELLAYIRERDPLA